MRISVKVQTRAKVEKVEELGAGALKVWVHSAPADNAANEEVIKLLAKHFGIAKSLIKIISGHTNRNKIIEIN